MMSPDIGMVHSQFWEEYFPGCFCLFALRRQKSNLPLFVEQADKIALIHLCFIRTRQ